MTFVKFVTPTNGRDSIRNTGLSIAAQTYMDWEWVIYGDIAPVPLPLASKIQWLIDPSPMPAGQRRNRAIEISRDAEWFAFVDDDDTVSRNYAMLLKHISMAHPEADIVVFRMQYEQGFILPPWTDPEIREGNVGISFAARSEVCESVKFVHGPMTGPNPNGLDDINFLLDAQSAGFNIYVSPHVAYYVRHYRPGV